MLKEETDQILEDLQKLARDMRVWGNRVRPTDGTPGRFRWALDTTREANVAATRYAVNALERARLLDTVWTEKDRAACAEWLQSMYMPENGVFRDPAIYDRRSPEWPADEPWPSPSMAEVINKYALDLWTKATDECDAGLPKPQPAPGWPTPEDSAESILRWFRDLPFGMRPWGAGSHAARMFNYLVYWEAQGEVGFDLVVRALRIILERQDPETGLWGDPTAGRYQQINGTFKLFSTLREIFDLPIPCADKIIDQVLDEMDRPDYEDNVAGCDELDNWYVLAKAPPLAGGHREAEVRDRAGRRIRRIVERYRQPDGGLSYRPGVCQTAWIGIDMAPAKAQSDAMGADILGTALSVCLELAGFGDRAPWRSGGNLHGAHPAFLPLDETQIQDCHRRILEAMGWSG
jgi:hypothetical protein